MTVAEEIELAWALLEIADPYFTPVERNNLFVGIVVGETFSVICALVAAIVGSGDHLTRELVGRLTAWLDAYIGHDYEPLLRECIDRMRRAETSASASVAVTSPTPGNAVSATGVHSVTSLPIPRNGSVLFCL
jgi:hypothetical protein